MISDAKKRDFIFILLTVYFAQGTLYAQGTIVSQLVFMSILAISGFYFLKALFIKKPTSVFFTSWTTLLLLNIFGLVLTGDISNPYHFSMVKGILITSLLFYPFYYFSYKGLLEPKHLTRFLFILIPLFVLQYYFNAATILDERVSDKTDVVNNVAYFFVGLIPYIFFIKQKKIFAFFIMLILVFFIVQSAKRGALISGVIGLLLFSYYHLRTIERKNRHKGYFFVLMAIIGIGYYAYDLYVNNPYIVSRMEGLSEGSYSGRDVIFKNIFNSWVQSDNFINLLFGYGFAASLKLSGTGNFAHNDWLELLSNFGLLGVMVYIVLFASIFKKSFSRDWKIDNRLILITILLICLINTMVYRFYSGGDSFLYSIVLGYLFGSENFKKQEF